MVSTADFVFVDARERRGLGVGAEMMWAKAIQTPLITLAPMDTHYRKEKTTILQFTVNDYTHPFVFSLSDVVVSSALEGGRWMKKHIEEPQEIKGKHHLKETMRHFYSSHFSTDKPFQEILQEFPDFQEKVDQLLDPSSV